MKKNYILILIAAISISFGSCSDFLEKDPDDILVPEDVFSDHSLIKTIIANFNDRISFGQHPAAQDQYQRLDEAVGQLNDGIQNMDRNWWREYNYELVRNLNEFIRDINTYSTLPEEDIAAYVAEVRVIRAWYYFCSVRSLGGVPLVYDELFEYIPGMDITTIQEPRAAEAAVYDYIIAECRAAAADLSPEKTINSGRANKWTAKMLEARAALYAGSLAKYTTGKYEDLTLPGGVVGIESGKADDYFKIALAAADTVIKHSEYRLQNKRENKATNFYEAVTIKEDNEEVIWARDYKYPGQTHSFTRDNIPFVLKRENSAANLCVLLNLVEEYEPINTTTPGQKQPFNIGDRKNPVFYDTPDGPFVERDPRLMGTVLVNGSEFAGVEIVYQAGLLSKNDKGEWDVELSQPGGGLTSMNGPIKNSERLVNKTGFSMRKYLDDEPSAAAMMGSEIFAVRFRLAEAYLIAAEACIELNNGQAADYINPVRERAGVQPLVTVTMDQLIHERRVELAFEDHRYWDLKRWRLADVVWNPEAPTAQRRGLFPYKVNEPGGPNDGKWFFEEVDMEFIYPNPLKFEMRNYYSEMDNDWLNKNPKLIPNRYQY
ncbi:MAG: RagB/SusD family nutrient uptake outer membrane protein [Tannerellaceae bacterium]|nr:RagB/SusD family nutrient uptake outer membrane protein [Tannerellaceae bacterium]